MARKKTKYRAIFISDLHLGSAGAQAETVCKFLTENDSELLYLVGDIIDGWKFQRGAWYWDEWHTKVVSRLLKIGTMDTKVFFIPGNHDEFLRTLISDEPYVNGALTVSNEVVHQSISHGQILVVHGDLFDGIHRGAKWLSFLGDRAYDFLMAANDWVNYARRRFGLGYWSLSAYLKSRVKGVLTYVYSFEDVLSEHCRRKSCTGVICGHIHTPAIKTMDSGIVYMNCGDWVESCTAIVEHHDGRFEILTFSPR